MRRMRPLSLVHLGKLGVIHRGSTNVPFPLLSEPLFSIIAGINGVQPLCLAITLSLTSENGVRDVGAGSMGNVDHHPANGMELSAFSSDGGWSNRLRSMTVPKKAPEPPVA